MKRHELEHIIRAASDITRERDIVVVGSQAILGQFPEAPTALLTSLEADVFPRHRPDLSVEIDGAIGERSLFHETYGYYAHGVDETTATLPLGWMERLVALRNENTGGGVGWCLEVHDLAASKLVAGRPKDLEFIKTLLFHQLAQTDTIIARVDKLALSPGQIDLLQTRFQRIMREGGNR